MSVEKLYKNKDWLYQKYMIEKLSVQKIIKKCGLKSHASILYWLNKHNILKRNRGELIKKENNPFWGKRHAEKIKKHWSKIRKGRKMPYETKRKISQAMKGEKNHFFNRHHSEEIRKKISDATKRKFKLNPNLILKGKDNPNYGKIGILSLTFGKKHSLETRKKMSDAKKGKYSGENHPFWGKKLSKQHRENLSKSHIGIQSKENHPNWQGGISFEPYSPTFNNQLKKQVRSRDKHQCQFCGTRQNGREFPIHHINYNKNDDCSINLITLCDPHHSQTNKNRDKWQFFFEVYQEIRRD